MLDMKLDSIVDYFLCDGQGLFYFRPNGDSYQILYFPKDSYRAYRDQTGELESVCLDLLIQCAADKHIGCVPKLRWDVVVRRNGFSSRYIKIGLNKRFRTKRLSLKIKEG